MERGWALVTGASSGIGRSLATLFCQKSIPVVAVSRDQDRLEQFAKESKEKYGTEVIPIPCDLSNSSNRRDLIETIQSSGRVVEFLVNNAGSTVHGSFLQTPLSEEEALLQVQVQSLVELTKAFLPAMVKRKCGRILNVASVYSFCPVPQQAVYAAAKSFMQSFSEALQAETQTSGVSVTVLYPGVTLTEFRTRAGMKEKQNSRLAMLPDVVARAGFEAMMKGLPSVTPGIWNKAFTLITKHLPHDWRTHFIARVNQKRGLESGDLDQ